MKASENQKFSDDQSFETVRDFIFESFSFIDNKSDATTIVFQFSEIHGDDALADMCWVIKNEAQLKHGEVRKIILHDIAGRLNKMMQPISVDFRKTFFLKKSKQILMKVLLSKTPLLTIEKFRGWSHHAEISIDEYIAIKFVVSTIDSTEKRIEFSIGKVSKNSDGSHELEFVTDERFTTIRLNDKLKTTGFELFGWDHLTDQEREELDLFIYEQKFKHADYPEDIKGKAIDSARKNEILNRVNKNLFNAYFSDEQRMDELQTILSALGAYFNKTITIE